MAFDIKEFFIAVVAVVIGAYILNYLGILKHTSPASARGGIARGGIGSNVPRNGYNRGMGIPQSVNPVNPIMVPRGAGVAGGRVMNNVGPTEPRSANMSKSIGGRPFVT